MTPLRGDGTAITQAATAAETRAREVAAAFNERFEAWAAAEDFQDLTQEARGGSGVAPERGHSLDGGVCAGDGLHGIPDRSDGQRVRPLLQLY